METADFRVILREFGEYLTAVGYRKSTQKGLYQAVQSFLIQLEEKGIQELEALERTDLEDWHRELKERPNKRRSGALSNASIRGYLWAVQLLLEQELQKGRLSRNLMSAYPMPRAEHQKRESLTREEIKALYAACETLKERLILHLHYGLGLRRSEAGRLNTDDLDLTKGWIRIKKGKYEKGRSLPLTLELTKDFERYLQEERPKTEENALVINNKGKRQRGNSSLNTLKKLLNKACIHKEIDLHCLRHSIATHLIQSGLDIEKLRLWLGHSRIESTKTYIGHDPERVFKSKVQTQNS